MHGRVSRQHLMDDRMQPHISICMRTIEIHGGGRTMHGSVSEAKRRTYEVHVEELIDRVFFR
jgi:hypothetical protein